MVVRACLLLMSWFAVVTIASADDRGDEKRVCVDASTQGQTDRNEGRLLDARSQFLRCARDTCPAIVKKSCGAWLSELEPRIPSIVLRVVDASGAHVLGARVALDGAEVTVDGRAQMLDPGAHSVAVEAPDMKPTEKSFLLSEGEKARALIVSVAPAEHEAPAQIAPEPVTQVASTPTPAPTPLTPEPEAFRVPTGAWVLGGVGLLGLAGFTGFGVSSKKKYDELEESCGGACTSEQTHDGRRDAVIANVALGVGVGALIGATVWGLAAWRRAHRPVAVALAPRAGGATARLHLTF